MKRVLFLLAAAVMAFGITAPAQATSFSFGGSIGFADGDSDGFRETLTFGTAYVFSTAPADPVVGMFDEVQIVPGGSATLDATSYVSGVSYPFSPSLYAGGFQLVDTFGSSTGYGILADLTLTPLVPLGATGTVNALMSLNLSGITALGGYSVGGGSALLDAFLTAPGGATNLVITAGGSLTSLIEGSGEVSTGFSGSAAPVDTVPTPVPEPGTLLLMGSGLLGLAGWGRRKMRKGDDA